MYFSDTLTNVLKTDLKMSVVPMLAGEPGIGKSSAVADLALALGTKMFSVPCNTLADKADLTGARLVPYTKEDGTEGYKQTFYPHHVIQEAVDYAESRPRETPILFLDEINRTTSDVTSGVLTLVTERKIGHVSLPENLRLIVAGNDRGNVTTLDEASISRFAVYRVEPDAHTLIGILGNKLHPWIKEVLTANPSLVFAKKISSIGMADGDPDADDDSNSITVTDLYDQGEEMSQITTPRTIENLSRWLNATDMGDITAYLSTTTQTRVGDDLRESNMLMEIIEAKVGETMFAVQLLGVISKEVASGNANAAAVQITVPRPQVFDDLKGAATVDQLNAVVAGMNQDDLGGSLLFAIKDGEDNVRIIESVSAAMTQLNNGHTKILFELVQNNQFNRANLDAFMGSGSPIASNVSPFLGSFLS